MEMTKIMGKCGAGVASAWNTAGTAVRNCKGK